MLLGFDTVGQACRITGNGELGLLRLALYTIASALGRQMLEEARNRPETRLEQARLLETVGTLAGGIARNFKNIVGAILGYVEYAGEQSVARRHDLQPGMVSVSAVIEEGTIGCDKNRTGRKKYTSHRRCIQVTAATIAFGR